MGRLQGDYGYRQNKGTKSPRQATKRAAKVARSTNKVPKPNVQRYKIK